MKEIVKNIIIILLIIICIFIYKQLDEKEVQIAMQSSIVFLILFSIFLLYNIYSYLIFWRI